MVVVMIMMVVVMIVVVVVMIMVMMRVFVVMMRVFMVMIVVMMRVMVMMMAVIMVMMVMMVMIMVMMVMEIDQEAEAGEGVSALGALDGDGEAVEGELVQLAADVVEGDAEVDERGDGHIPGDARDEVEVEVGHGASPWVWSARLILAAAQAAPKPLSMLTTVSPAEQLLSMVRRAERPPKAAP